MIRMKELPRREDGTIEAPGDRLQPWINLHMVDLAITNGLELDSPSKCNMDQMLYNTCKKATILRRCYIELACAVLDGGDAEAVAMRHFKTISEVVFAELDGKKKAAG